MLREWSPQGSRVTPTKAGDYRRPCFVVGLLPVELKGPLWERSFAARMEPAGLPGNIQYLEVLLNGLAGAPGGFRCLDGQEPPVSFQAICSAFDDDYSWQPGMAFSSSLPQVFNQVRTSSPVRWRPVSL